jgi:FkbM family methyltransferase
MVEANKNCEPELRKLGSAYHIAALSDKEGTRVFFRNDQKISSGESFYRERSVFFSDAKCATSEIETTTLDVLFPGRRFDLIKADTQGSELDILKGGTALCSRASYILLEASVTNYNEGAPLLKDVLVSLDSMNYDLIDICNCAYANHAVGKHYDDLCQVDVLFKNRKVVV